METLSAHYARLLAIDDAWRVQSVDLRLEERRVNSSQVRRFPGLFPGLRPFLRSCRSRRQAAWRHLDTMQVATGLVDRPLRCRCPEHGVKTVLPPWSGKNTRFTPQASSAKPSELLPLQDHQCRTRGLQQRHSGPKACGRRVTFLSELTHSHPLLLPKARPQAAATLRLKSGKKFPSYFLYRITNAAGEGFNSAIHTLQYAAPTFRSFANYRTRMRSFFGKQDLEQQLHCQ
jgi:hypothetical protein